MRAGAVLRQHFFDEVRDAARLAKAPRLRSVRNGYIPREPANRRQGAQAFGQHGCKDLGKRHRRGHAVPFRGKQRIQARIRLGAVPEGLASLRRGRCKLGVLEPLRLHGPTLRPQDACAPINPSHLSPRRVEWAEGINQRAQRYRT